MTDRSDNCLPGCEFTVTIVGDTSYKCHREVVPGSIYCKLHAIEYEIPQGASEPIPGVFVSPKHPLSEVVDKFRELLKDPEFMASLTEHRLVALEIVNAAMTSLLE